MNYINGNYLVRTYRSGLRTEKICLHLNEEFSPEFPDSIDIKLTNYCTHGCSFCHESSSPNGKHGDLVELKKVLSRLPKVPIELALGGGNALEHPDLLKFIGWCRDRNFEPRITISINDLDNPLVKLIPIPMGISIYKFDDTVREKLEETFPYAVHDIVFHVIIGVFPLEDLQNLLDSRPGFGFAGILVLGFKQFGRAKNQEPQHLKEWSEFFKSYIYRNRMRNGFNNGISVAFDNLAIEQLGLKNILLQNEWDRRYFGSEFSSSMYIDAVEQTFAPTSRSTERVKWSETGLLEYFKNNHNAF